MHLGNGIICPVTGIPMIALALGTAVYAFKQAKKDFSKDKILPAVALTGLVFGLQMINFAIPSTGSSGHIIGAILLAALLGPYVGFLSMCLIILTQALFFADGGILALGCNIFNMGIVACFIAYPFIYKPFAAKNRVFTGALLASVAALQLGALSAVFESTGSVSGNIWNFMGLMQGIHLPIGMVEGIVTGAVIVTSKFVDSRKMTAVFGTLAVILAGVVSSYASQKPDGLEWSLLNISDSVTAQTQSIFFALSESVQAKTAVLVNAPSVLANLAGLVIVGVLMYALCMLLFNTRVNSNAE